MSNGPITAAKMLAALASYGYQTALFTPAADSTVDLVTIRDFHGRDETEFVLDHGEILRATGSLADNALIVLTLYAVITEEQRVSIPTVDVKDSPR
jgi:hypothetical protein